MIRKIISLFTAFALVFTLFAVGAVAETENGELNGPPVRFVATHIVDDLDNPDGTLEWGIEITAGSKLFQRLGTVVKFNHNALELINWDSEPVVYTIPVREDGDTWSDGVRIGTRGPDIIATRSVTAVRQGDYTFLEIEVGTEVPTVIPDGMGKLIVLRFRYRDGYDWWPDGETPADSTLTRVVNGQHIRFPVANLETEPDRHLVATSRVEGDLVRYVAEDIFRIYRFNPELEIPEGRELELDYDLEEPNFPFMPIEPGESFSQAPGGTRDDFVSIVFFDWDDSLMGSIVVPRNRDATPYVEEFERSRRAYYVDDDGDLNWNVEDAALIDEIMDMTGVDFMALTVAQRDAVRGIVWRYNTWNPDWRYEFIDDDSYYVDYIWVDMPERFPLTAKKAYRFNSMWLPFESTYFPCYRDNDLEYYFAQGGAGQPRDRMAATHRAESVMRDLAVNFDFTNIEGGFDGEFIAVRAAYSATREINTVGDMDVAGYRLAWYLPLVTTFMQYGSSSATSGNYAIRISAARENVARIGVTRMVRPMFRGQFLPAGGTWEANGIWALAESVNRDRINAEFIALRGFEQFDWAAIDADILANPLGIAGGSGTLDTLDQGRIYEFRFNDGNVGDDGFVFQSTYALLRAMSLEAIIAQEAGNPLPGDWNTATFFDIDTFGDIRITGFYNNTGVWQNFVPGFAGWGITTAFRAKILDNYLAVTSGEFRELTYEEFLYIRDL